MKETQGGRERLPGQSTKYNTVWEANGREHQVENIKCKIFVSSIKLI